ncbi:MAG: acylneuraminate cytidylyltransferase family protein [Nanoarchaeota archaeon]
MYKNNFILGVIPARGGSKGIKKKNIRLLAGKPLICYSIEQAQKSAYIDTLIVSTDDQEIASVARKHKAEVPFLRPQELAQDNTPMYPVLQHAVKEMEKRLKRKIDIIVLLDPTAPLRSAEDIDQCIAKLVDEHADTVITVVEADRSPYFNMVEFDKNGVMHVVKKPKKPIYRRQDAPKVYTITSGVYAIRREILMEQNTVFGKKTKAIIIPEERAGHIDSEIEFQFLDFIMRKRKY